MAILIAVVALLLVTAAHEAGHGLGVVAKGGRVRRVQVGRGPAVWRSARPDARLVVSLVPIGGRIHYDGVPAGTGEAVVAASGAAANLALAFASFAVAAGVLGSAAPLPAAGAGAAAYAVAHAGAWFWVVPGAVVELVSTGSAVGLRRAVGTLVDLVLARPLSSLPYTVGSLSALSAALNLIPVPGLETDGWHVIRSLWRGRTRNGARR